MSGRFQPVLTCPRFYVSLCPQSAIRDDNPVVVLEHELMYGVTFKMSEAAQKDDFYVPFGKAKLEKEGTDVTIISYSRAVGKCIEAAEALAADGVSAEVINLLSIRPMDRDAIIKSVMKTNRCITVEEGWPVCSIGNHISAVLMQEAFDYLDAPVINCTGKDVPMPYAANLEKLALITTGEVVAAVHQVTYR